jgi:hypothetical protein
MFAFHSLQSTPPPPPISTPLKFTGNKFMGKVHYCIQDDRGKGGGVCKQVDLILCYVQE